MKKISTVRVNGNMIFKGHQLTIGVDLGDRWSCYCVLEEAGEILLELARNFSVGKAGRKNKEQRKGRDGIQTAELDRRDQVTATNSWPNFPSRQGNRGRLSGSSTY